VLLNGKVDINYKSVPCRTVGSYYKVENYCRLGKLVGKTNIPTRTLECEMYNLQTLQTSNCRRDNYMEDREVECGN